MCEVVCVGWAVGDSREGERVDRTAEMSKEGIVCLSKAQRYDTGWIFLAMSIVPAGRDSTRNKLC